MKIAQTTKEADGSCNECQSREEPEIIVITLKTIQFRLCLNCADNLAVEMRRLAWVKMKIGEGIE